jgi:hypothetical protein
MRRRSWRRPAYPRLPPWPCCPSWPASSPGWASATSAWPFPSYWALARGRRLSPRGGHRARRRLRLRGHDALAPARVHGGKRGAFRHGPGGHDTAFRAAAIALRRRRNGVCSPCSPGCSDRHYAGGIRSMPLPGLAPARGARCFALGRAHTCLYSGCLATPAAVCLPYEYRR